MVSSELRAVEELYNEHKLKLRLALWGELEDPARAFWRSRRSSSIFRKSGSRFRGFTEKSTVRSAHAQRRSTKPTATTHALMASRFTFKTGSPSSCSKPTAQAFRSRCVATGDRAVSISLNAPAAAKKQLFNSHLRNRVENVEVAPPFAYDKFSDYHIIVGMQPARMSQDSEARNDIEARLGPERSREAFSQFEAS